jgi:hypothetical protein
MMERLAPGLRRALALAITASLAGIAPAQAPVDSGAAGGIRVTVREGEGALNNVRTARAKEPVVVVTDAADRPLAGASVAFLLPELGASAVFPTGSAMTITTGDDGVAVGRGMKPNNAAGSFEIRVVASYQGQVARAVVHQTNVAPKAPSSGSGRKTAVLLAVIGGAGAALAVGVTRGGKDSPAAANPGASISAGGTTFGPPR